MTGDENEKYTPVDYSEILEKMSPESRARIEAGAEEDRKIIETLYYLRQELKLSPEGLAETLGLPRKDIARIVRDADLVLVTLQNAIAAAGGNLSILVEMPEKQDIKLDEIADLIDLQSES
ncbi:MAG: XRE family transcriptional regulator [Micavibrio sp.]|nr:MAG: XRE family transcriptional regulator [Micavibrio sp.]